jgi:hypothetical protein
LIKITSIKRGRRFEQEGGEELRGRAYDDLERRDIYDER